MRHHRERLRATREFAASHGWTLTGSVRSEDEQRALLERLSGEPFHPPEREPAAYLGRHEHRLSEVMRGAHGAQSAVVFAYTRRQEVLDDGFGRHGWENQSHWIAALLDLPAPGARLQITPRTPVPPAEPGVTVGVRRVDEHFHIHTDDPDWAAGVLRDLAPVLLTEPHRSWRISGTSGLTWTRLPASGVPLDAVDGTLERLSAIAGRGRRAGLRTGGQPPEGAG